VGSSKCCLFCSSVSPLPCTASWSNNAIHSCKYHRKEKPDKRVKQDKLGVRGRNKPDQNEEDKERQTQTRGESERARRKSKKQRISERKGQDRAGQEQDETSGKDEGNSCAREQECGGR
jgi:hypothetical protein